MNIRKLTTNLKTFSAAALLLSSSLLHAQTMMLDKVIAIVDDDVVMSSELQQQLSAISSRAQAANTALPPIDVLKTQILEHLVVERLQLISAERANIKVDEREINQAIARIQQGNKLSPEDFAQQLRAQGLTPRTFREKIRRDMTIEQVQQGRVNRRIQISEQEVDNFLHSTEGKFWTSPDYQLGHILISLSNGAIGEEADNAEEKAQALFQQLQGGADFKQLAIANSSGQRALNGGDLGWRKYAQLPGAFADTAATLKKGDISEPFRSNAGFHILKLYDQRGGAQELIIEQAKLRHILLKTSAILNDNEAHAKLKELRKEVIDGADFAELAKQNSEDIGSMLSGGDLGWSTPGQFVPEFEEVMAQTQVGETSMPFRSQFGWHILQVQERRKEDMSDTMIRNQAHSLLRKRRFEEELQNWLQEIRDEAYVEIKL